MLTIKQLKRRIDNKLREEQNIKDSIKYILLEEKEINKRINDKLLEEKKIYKRISDKIIKEEEINKRINDKLLKEEETIKKVFNKLKEELDIQKRIDDKILEEQDIQKRIDDKILEEQDIQKRIDDKVLEKQDIQKEQNDKLEKLDIDIINKSNFLREVELNIHKVLKENEENKEIEKLKSFYDLKDSVPNHTLSLFIHPDKKMFIELVNNYKIDKPNIVSNTNDVSYNKYFSRLSHYPKGYDFNELIKDNLVKEFKLFNKKLCCEIKVFVIINNEKMRFLTNTFFFNNSSLGCGSRTSCEMQPIFFSLNLNYHSLNYHSLNFDLHNAIRFCNPNSHTHDHRYKDQETNFINMCKFLQSPNDYELI